MATWNATFHTTPTGGSVPSTIDNVIRELKDSIEERMKNQHSTYTGDSTSGTAANDWLHKAGSAVCWYQSGEPTITLSAAQDGAIWIDSDTNIVYVYSHSASDFVAIFTPDPIGTVKFWDTDTGGAWTDNSTIAGWYQCNGENGTPDMRNQYVVAAATSGAGDDTNAMSGGSVSVTVAEANLPEHTHTIAHTHFLSNTSQVADGVLSATSYLCRSRETGILQDKDYFLNGSSTAPTVGLTSASSAESSGSVGSGTALDITMPYYKLIPIIRIS